jgi:hypothetical protein
MDDKTVIGSTELVKIKGKSCMARIDTGALRSSICLSLAEELDLGPTLKHVRVKSPHGKDRRPVIEESIVLAGKKIKATFNVVSRCNMKYQVLIGRRVLMNKFLVDPSK